MAGPNTLMLAARTFTSNTRPKSAAVAHFQSFPSDAVFMSRRDFSSRSDRKGQRMERLG